MTTTLATTFRVNCPETAARHLAGVVIGLIVTAGLFWMMQYLIDTADRELVNEPMRATLEFVRLIRDKPIRPKPPKVIDRPTKPPPDLPRPDNLGDSSPTIDVGDMDAPDIPPGDPVGSDIFDGYGEGDYLPIVKVEPIYPARALSRGIEGYCVIEFTLTRHGTVRNPFVVESQCTHSVFERASLEAVLKFKYKPRVIDGVQIEVPGVQNKFTFRITD